MQGIMDLNIFFVPYMEQWLKENCPEIQTVTDDNQSPFFCHIESVFGIYGGCEYVKDSFKNRQRMLYI